nr:MAG TPA: hypothetical protein [Caudoviricetes sp.]
MWQKLNMANGFTVNVYRTAPNVVLRHILKISHLIVRTVD